MLYKREFGQDFELGFDLRDHPYLTDKSWHNDVSPSFYFKVEEQFYVLWVDFQDPEQREYSNCRYLIQEAINEGTEDTPEISSSDCSIIFESEYPAELINFVNMLLLTDKLS